MRIESFLTMNKDWQTITVLISAEAESLTQVVSVMEISVDRENPGFEETHIHSELGSIFHAVANNIMKTTGPGKSAPLFEDIKLKEPEELVVSEYATSIVFYEQTHGGIVKAHEDRVKNSKMENRGDIFCVPIFLFDGEEIFEFSSLYADRWQEFTARERTKEDPCNRDK